MTHDDSPPPRAPDAFFPGIPRRRVVLLGALLVVAGVAVAVFVPPLTVIQGSGSQSISTFFFFAGIATAIFGVVCIVKRPTRGSAPGSEKYHQLIEKQRADTYRTFIRNTVIALVLSVGLTLYFVLAGLLGLDDDPRRSQTFMTIGVLTAIGAIICGLGLHAAVHGKLKNVRPPER